eukprot:CAMPEP_0178992250 /NCGR_PEP_ID=MMETSP0795-20121207/6002_1 /TAXON_ID=88552 /ORGANISM="Amoebophrya sp., Strain Ameob2" /LENGTH=252 /DNA_ID=CAMNT_0020684095 /DNA_START=857 /DNA_END=1616 /DNA_ORIENTATION=-
MSPNIFTRPASTAPAVPGRIPRSGGGSLSIPPAALHGTPRLQEHDLTRTYSPPAKGGAAFILLLFRDHNDDRDNSPDHDDERNDDDPQTHRRHAALADVLLVIGVLRVPLQLLVLRRWPTLDHRQQRLAVVAHQTKDYPRAFLDALGIGISVFLEQRLADSASSAGAVAADAPGAHVAAALSSPARPPALSATLGVGIVRHLVSLRSSKPPRLARIGAALRSSRRARCVPPTEADEALRFYFSSTNRVLLGC